MSHTCHPTGSPCLCNSMPDEPCYAMTSTVMLKEIHARSYASAFHSALFSRTVWNKENVISCKMLPNISFQLKDKHVVKETVNGHHLFFLFKTLI